MSLGWDVTSVLRPVDLLGDWVSGPRVSEQTLDLCESVRSRCPSVDVSPFPFRGRRPSHFSGGEGTHGDSKGRGHPCPTGNQESRVHWSSMVCEYPSVRRLVFIEEFITKVRPPPHTTLLFLVLRDSYTLSLGAGRTPGPLERTSPLQTAPRTPSTE